MKERIYVCHTYYHAYIACLKELVLHRATAGKATLLLSRLSNDFGDLCARASASGLFEQVLEYDEKDESFFPQLKAYHTDRGNILFNMLARIKYTKQFGKLQAPYVPVDFRSYRDIYVFCDSDPIGYYLSSQKIYYHAVEDGLDCIKYYDTARYDNRGYFGVKAWMAAHNLIFIQNGYGKYCLDMEVNDISVLPYPGPKYIEQSREELVAGLKAADKELITAIFIADLPSLREKLNQGGDTGKVLILTEPLCDLTTRETIFRDIIVEYGTINGRAAQIIIKPHPRDRLDYCAIFSGHIVLDGMFPMEILNFIPDLTIDRVVAVFTVPSAIRFAGERIFLGEDFMDRYEAPEIHRQNEMI
ncbi:MAG: glycosyltransferase family 52 protein [Lachnospiraceae bacterium]|nr:glycosyltransferase family 52 protein [Lachnospiraceae bacterium]